VNRLAASAAAAAAVACLLLLGWDRVAPLPPLLRWAVKWGGLLLLLLAGALVGLRAAIGRARADAVSARGVALAVGIALALAGGELAVRVLLRDVTTTADNGSFFARRWTAQHVQLNSQGFREREFPLEKPPGVYRIALVGDSVGYGQGIDDDERFARLVERSLRAGGTPAEVITFTRPGTETVDHLKVLRESVLPAHPDFVLLQWYENDYWGPYTPPVWGEIRPLWPHWTRGFLESHSALYFLLNRAWSDWQWSQRGGEDAERPTLERFADPDSEESRWYRALLAEFIGLCRQHGAEVGVVLFPRLSALTEEPYPYAALQALVAEAFERHGAQALDLRGAFAPYAGAPDQLFVNRYDAHPNALANRAAAEAILAAFGPQWRAGAAGS
jgi:hypothetical protein